MKYYIKTLTPLHIGNLHIGNGEEELSSLDYVLHQNKFYRISQQKFLEFLNKNKINLDDYSKWIVETTEKINDINDLENERRRNRNNFGKDKNQQLSELKKNFNLLNFSKSIKKESEFINYLKTLNGISFEGIIKQKVRGFIKNGNNEPYIPGTSIKGAIRSALLYDYLSKHAKVDEIKNILEKSIKKIDRKKLNESKKEFANELENEAFYCKYSKVNNEITNDEKYDILKFLIVSDGKVISDNPLTLENIDLYLVKKDRNGTFADVQKQTPTVEAVKENSIIEFELDFNIDYLLSIKKNLNDKGYLEVKIGQNIEKQWIGIKEKVKNIFDLDIDNLNENNKDEFKKNAIESIIKKINNFSKKQIEWDQKWLNNITQKNSKSKFNNSHIEQGFNKVKGNALIHFGFGSGYTGITEFLYFLENNELKMLFKRVMDKFLIGDKPGTQKNRKNGESYSSNPDNFPKSKRLVTRKNEILPLGWAIITNTLDSNIAQTAVNVEKVEQKPIEPQYFKGKLKQGTDGIFAKVIKSGKPNKVKLFIEGIEDKEFTLLGYSSEIEEGKIIYVKINQMNKKGEILQVGFDKFLSQ